MADFFFTAGNHARTHKNNGRVVLVQGYWPKPERSVGKRGKVQRAVSYNQRFLCDDIPKDFETKEEASTYLNAFRRHVENVLRGDSKGEFRLAVQPKPASLQATERAKRAALLRCAICCDARSV